MFRVPQLPTTLPELVKRLTFAFTDISQEFGRPKDYLSLQVLHVAPDRVTGGMVVLADGSDWQPDGVNGEGMYRRDKANAIWVFVG